jgi:hypothetical protein
MNEKSYFSKKSEFLASLKNPIFPKDFFDLN